VDENSHDDNSSPCTLQSPTEQLGKRRAAPKPRYNIAMKFAARTFLGHDKSDEIYQVVKACW
jgi:hypothetical protein